MEKIIGKVVKIKDEYSVVINVGDSKGASIGDRVYIINTILENITDPDTGEDLGDIVDTKCTLYISHVYEKVSVCAASQESTVYEAMSLALNSLSMFSEKVPLNIDYNDLETLKVRQDDKIKVGDVVYVFKSKKQ